MSQTKHNRRIDYIEFCTTDIPRTKNFYSNVFGWEFEDFGPQYTAFKDGRLNGGFALSESVPKGGGPLVIIYATDLEALEQAVKSAGGRITKEIFPFPGGRRFHFADPGGNELAIWSDNPLASD